MKSQLTDILLKNMYPSAGNEGVRLAIPAETLVVALLRCTTSTDKNTAVLIGEAFYWLPHLEHCPPALRERMVIRRDRYPTMTGQTLRTIMERRLKDMELI